MKESKKESNYIFLDESGKPEIFSRKGVNLVEKGLTSKYLVVAAVRTNDQLSVQQAVTESRLNILKNKELKKTFSPSYALDSFHAQTDYPVVRKLYYHNPHYTHGGLQIADYVSYAVFQIFERQKREFYEIIKNRVGYIQDLFNKKSYSRSNPL